MTAFFSDDFIGSAGNLVGHAPEVGFSGLAWSSDPDGSGTQIHLDGNGYIQPQFVSAPDTVGIAAYGILGTDYGNPKDIILSFVLRTGANVGLEGTKSHRGMELFVRNGGALTSYRVWGQYASGAMKWYMDITTDAGDVVDITSSITPNTDYTGTIEIKDGVQKFTFPGGVRNGSMLYANAVGLERVLLNLGGYTRLSSLRVEPFVVGAALVAPSPTLTAFGGGTANLTGPIGVIESNPALATGSANLVAPSPVLVADGRPQAGAALTCPAALLSAFGGACAALAAPVASLYASGHDSAGEKAANLTAPKPTLSAYGGANAKLASPRPALAFTATVTGWGDAAMSAPAPTLAASGTVAAMAQARLDAPMASLVGYGGAVCSITLTGSPTLLATATTGGIGHAALACPLFELVATGAAQNHGSANLLAPSPRLGATAQAWLIAPAGKLTAIGSAVVAASYEAYSINLSHRDPEANDEVTRYTSFPFTHIVRYQGSYFGVAADGLYLLEGTTDDGAAIPYALKTCIDDFKAPELKNVASAYLSGRLGPDMTVSLHAGETGSESYAYTTPRGQTAQNHREKFGRGVKSRYFALGLAGTDALELDTVELEINKTKRRI